MTHWQDSPTASGELQRIRAEALQEPCPTCGVGVGEVCRNKVTEQPLAKVPAHNSRLKQVVI